MQDNCGACWPKIITLQLKKKVRNMESTKDMAGRDTVFQTQRRTLLSFMKTKSLTS